MGEHRQPLQSPQQLTSPSADWRNVIPSARGGVPAPPRCQCPGQPETARTAMSHQTQRPAGGTVSQSKPDDRFGPTVATALIMGSIIGVGIFNLPTSLSSYGPITLVSMGLTTV